MLKEYNEIHNVHKHRIESIFDGNENAGKIIINIRTWISSQAREQVWVELCDSPSTDGRERR